MHAYSFSWLETVVIFNNLVFVQYAGVRPTATPGIGNQVWTSP